MTAPEAEPPVTARRPRLWPITLPIALAVLFALLSLRGAENSVPMFPDAARHALNGVLLYDMVRDGEPPTGGLRAANSKFPAISLPYHPPLFPAMEAMAFSFFGVSHETARIVVALTVFLSALLLSRLVLESHASRPLAGVVVGVFLSIPHSQWLGQDVMLEFPSFMFVFAALLYLRRTASRPSLWRLWLLFFALSGAAIWTKQHAAFLVAIPVGWLVLGAAGEIWEVPAWGASAPWWAWAWPDHGVAPDRRGSNRLDHEPITDLRSYRLYSGVLLHNRLDRSGLVAASALT